ncbi:MAG TPA: proton-conducting transporter membrane subunit [Acidimicrobiales bacterium]
MAWIVPLVPLVGAAAVVMSRRRPHVAATVAVTAAATAAGAGWWAAATAATGTWRWGEGLRLELAVTGLAQVMVVLVPAVAVPVLAYAASAMRDDPGLVRLLALLQVFVAGMLQLVAAADLLTVLIAWEIVGACSWGLISHQWRDPTRPTAALHAFLTTRAADLGLLAAAAVALATTGSMRYDTLGELRGWPVHAVSVGILLAALAKSAQVPFSPWLFSAMAGPTSVSALLHSATMVAAGAYLLARTVPELGAAGWLPGAVVGFGLLSAVAGGLVATAQTDLKRALAASTTAQYGLMFVAVGSGSVAAAGAHLVTHAIFKSLLFLGAGIALHAAGSGYLGALRLGRALPFAAATFWVGALALAALPPLGAAWSKEEILSATVHRGAWVGAGVLLASLLSALYAGRLAVLAYGPGEPVAGERPTWPERAAVGALAATSVLLGVLWIPALGERVEALTGGDLAAGAAWELPVSLALIGAAAVAVRTLARRGHLLDLALGQRLTAFVAGWFGLSTLARVAVVDPVLALSRVLARFDDRVADAGVRAAARITEALSRSLSSWGERTFDGTVLGAARTLKAVAAGSWRFDDGPVDGFVRGTAAGTVLLASGSRRFDEGGVDGTVEGLARVTGVAGRRARQLQTGLSHHYYVIVAAGLVVAVAVIAFGR